MKPTVKNMRAPGKNGQKTWVDSSNIRGWDHYK